MVDELSGDETELNEKSTTSINRRRFIKTIGATGIAATGLSNAAASSVTEKREVDELTGEQRDDIITEIQTDSNVQEIISEFNPKGWKPQFDGGHYMHVKRKEKGEYYGAVIPFNRNSGDSSNDILLVWLDATV